VGLPSGDWTLPMQFLTTLWQTNIVNWKMAIEIVDLPIKNGDYILVGGLESEF
jgi:hypothetical protein